MSIDPVDADPADAPTPLAVRLWFGWAFALLAITGLLLGRIVEFIDFSDFTIFRDSFSANGTAVGPVILAGLRVPVGDACE